MKQRNSKGQFKYTPFKHSTWGGLILLLTTMTLGAYIEARYSPVELHNPLGTVQVHAQAPEPVVELIVEPLNTYGAPQHIVDLIVKHFGDEAQNALKVVGTCENKGWNQQAINHNRNGSTDHGIFQVNSIHIKRHGEGFKTSLEENIRVASEIQKASGWRAWACSEVIGVTPFWKEAK